MKIKIKYTSTKKFVINFEKETLSELVADVKKFIKETYGEDLDCLALSLNGTDVLQGQNESLRQLGVVPMDMLTVVTGAAAMSNDSDSSSSNEKQDSGASGGAASKNASASAGPAVEEGSNVSDQEKQPAAVGFSACGGAARQRPSTLLEVTSSVSGIPVSLETLLASHTPNSASQLVNLLAHLTMVECGYRVPGVGDSVSPPPGYDQMVANLTYSHNNYENFTCTLVLVTMGEQKQLLVSFPNQDTVISTTINLSDYIDRDAASKEPINEMQLKNVAKFSQKLRNDLLVPLQLAAHRLLGLPSPAHLAGLPTELLIHIMKYLKARDCLNLTQCCKRLSEVSKDDSVWEYYCKRDFKRPVSKSENVSYVKVYADMYQQKKNSSTEYFGPYRPNIHIPYPNIYPTQPGLPHPPTFPYNPRPVPIGPYPSVPNPAPPLNPYSDPDSPYYGGEIPNHPPPVAPFNPLAGGPPMMGDPNNPFGDPGFGGLGPDLPRRPRNNNPPGFGGGPGGFRFI